MRLFIFRRFHQAFLDGEAVFVLSVRLRESWYIIKHIEYNTDKFIGSDLFPNVLKSPFIGKAVFNQT